MKVWRSFVVAGALMLALAGAGHAADYRTMPPPASYTPPVAPSFIPRDIFWSGWYLRADIGQRWGFLTAVDAPFGISPATDSSGNATALGLGAGFRHNWIRGDVTVDYATQQSYQGSAASPGDVSAKIQTATALINIYADLGTWYRLTPYIGAGIGTARVTISDFQSATVPPFTGTPSQSQWNLAWAAMAGTAFALTKKLQVDIGYRFLNFGNAHTADGPFGNATFRNLGAHEVRVGLRWNFDDLAIQ